MAPTVRSETAVGFSAIGASVFAAEHTARTGKAISHPHLRAMRAPSNMYDIGIYSFPFEIFRVRTSFVACREIKKPPAAPTISRIRWRLGWHGGDPLQPRGSVPPSFDGFTLGSVGALVSLSCSMPRATSRAWFASHKSDAFAARRSRQSRQKALILIGDFGITCSKRTKLASGVTCGAQPVKNFDPVSRGKNSEHPAWPKCEQIQADDHGQRDDDSRHKQKERRDRD